MKKVFIADDQLITPLGFSSEENIRALKNKCSGIKKQSQKSISPTDFYASLIENDQLANAFSVIGNPEHYTKLEQMLLLAVGGILQRHPSLALEKTALIVSTTKGNIEALDENTPFSNKKAKLYELAATILSFFNLKTEPIIVSNACISGGLAISIGKRFLLEGKHDHAIVVGGDLVSEFIFSGFNSFQAISTEPCKPFAKNRSGITLGEAAAAILLSCDNTLQSENSVFVLGTASANDANHISGPSRTGEGLFLSINSALEEAGIAPQEIDYISAHGTATVFNDEMEAIAFDRVGLFDTPLNSLKGFYGHTLGASALLETVVAARSLQNDELYPSLGFDSEDAGGVSKPVNVISSTEKRKLKTALKTASGFGGCNVALVLQKANLATEKQIVSVEENKQQAVFIQDYVHLKDNVLSHAGKTVYSDDSTKEVNLFAKACYEQLEMKYPKFHKMDTQCKLGILATETLVKKHRKHLSENTALVLSNNASSLDTDEKYMTGIQHKENYFPSPAVFVYTLPNIVLGEISIKYGLKSEQAFFVSETFDADLLVDYAKVLLKTKKTDRVICGWIDLYNHSYCVFLCLLSLEGKTPLTKENLTTIYNQNYE